MLLRSVAPRCQQLVSPDVHYRAHQKRWKSWRRNTDDDGVYYTLPTRDQRRDRQNQPHPSELFRVSNLLLNLDAEGAHTVRPFDNEDAKRMEETWSIDSKRQNVQARIHTLERHLFDGRARQQQLAVRPTHTWRITSHDILSVALRGAPEDLRHARLLSETTERLQPWEALDPDMAPATIRRLQAYNGIPDHALREDKLLLRWIMIRQNQYARSKTNSPARAALPSDFVKAIGHRNTIMEIRRLVFRSLDGGLHPSLFRESLHGVSRDGVDAFTHVIRDNCLRVLTKKKSYNASIVEALVFIGNLGQRLESMGLQLGAALRGLALKLSADAAVPEATLEYFHTGNCLDHWHADHTAAEDVSAAMVSYTEHLRAGQQQSLHVASGRQLLYQTMTGIDQNDVMGPISMRAFALALAAMPSTYLCEEGTALYKQYITALGHLGAVRMLWREWRDSAPTLAKAMEETKTWLDYDSSEKLSTRFAAALTAALGVAAIPEGSGTEGELGLARCATLDYFSVEAQDPRYWQGRDRNTQVDGLGVDKESAKEILGLSLDNYMEALRRLTTGAHMAIPTREKDGQI